MVVLMIVTTANLCTVYFDEPIPKPDYVRLFSCSLPNPWLNLKCRGQISLSDLEGKVATPKTFPEGHYTLKSMAEELENIFEEEGVLSTKINMLIGGMVIYNLNLRKICLDSDLAGFLGISRDLLPITYVKRLRSRSSYFVYCDLVDPFRNLSNRKASKQTGVSTVC